ncbi:MAG: hypothetical protein ACRDK8_15855 [Solirubrobacteraceae bacterium]
MQAAEATAPPAPEQAPEPQPVRPAADAMGDMGFIAFDELAHEIDAQTDPEPVEAPMAETAAPDPTAHQVSVPLELTSAVTAPSSVFRPRPMEPEPVQDRSAAQPMAECAQEPTAPETTVTPEATPTPKATAIPTPTEDETQTPAPAPTPDSEHAAAESIGQRRLSDRLTDHGLSASLADRLVADAAEAAGQQSEPMLIANAQATLTAMLPEPEQLPADGSVIAIVGPSGSGKTRVVAALAAAYARQGRGVTVARLRSAQRDDQLPGLLQGEDVDLIPAMTIRTTVREVEAARTEDLVILDTPATTVGDSWGLQSLAEMLGRFLPDGVLLCAPATSTRPALTKLVEHHTPLRIDGLVATHSDRTGMLGTVAEIAIETRIPLGHVHCGLDDVDTIASIDPHALAGDLVR